MLYRIVNTATGQYVSGPWSFATCMNAVRAATGNFLRGYVDGKPPYLIKPV